jgi:hypothetical protein
MEYFEKNAPLGLPPGKYPGKYPGKMILSSPVID